MLDASMARSQLGWDPTWSLREAIELTVDWHKAWLKGGPMLEVTRSQIRAYGAEP
jgi:CDP-glucose 4,6-dehydratase